MLSVHQRADFTLFAQIAVIGSKCFHSMAGSEFIINANAYTDLSEEQYEHEATSREFIPASPNNIMAVITEELTRTWNTRLETGFQDTNDAIDMYNISTRPSSTQKSSGAD